VSPAKARKPGREERKHGDWGQTSGRPRIQRHSRRGIREQQIAGRVSARFAEQFSSFCSIQCSGWATHSGAGGAPVARPEGQGPRIFFEFFGFWP